MCTTAIGDGQSAGCEVIMMISFVICYGKQAGGGAKWRMSDRKAKAEYEERTRQATKSESRSANDDSRSSLMVCNTHARCGHLVISVSLKEATRLLCYGFSVVTLYLKKFSSTD